MKFSKEEAIKKINYYRSIKEEGLSERAFDDAINFVNSIPVKFFTVPIVGTSVVNLTKRSLSLIWEKINDNSGIRVEFIFEGNGKLTYMKTIVNNTLISSIFKEDFIDFITVNSEY